MRQIGVIGAGIMGTGVAQVLAQNGYEVILIDISQDILDHANASIIRMSDMHKLWNQDALPPEEILNRITLTTDYCRLESVLFVIENVTEDINIKKEVYQKLKYICNKNCIFAVNTSCIPITKVASYTSNEANVIGTHFMNPVTMKHIVEVIKGRNTSLDTVNKTMNFLSSIGKKGILVKDKPGFVSNRISHLMINEAAFLVQEQVAGPEDVDNIFKGCFGHKMGPLETADLIGIDTVTDTLNILFEYTQDMKFKVCPLLIEMVKEGMIGMKSGRGFYEYYAG